MFTEPSGEGRSSTGIPSSEVHQVITKLIGVPSYKHWSPKSSTTKGSLWLLLELKVIINSLVFIVVPRGQFCVFEVTW